MEPDLTAWRAEVPALRIPVHGRRLAYLDNASTTLQPQAVTDAVARVATHLPGNVHRGVHALSEAATEAFDAARATIAHRLGAGPDEIVHDVVARGHVTPDDRGLLLVSLLLCAAERFLSHLRVIDAAVSALEGSRRESRANREVRALLHYQKSRQGRRTRLS